MAKSSADDEELRRACEATLEGTKQKVALSMRVAKSRGIFGKTGKLGRAQMAKARVLAICTKEKATRTKAFLRVMKYTNGGVLEATKIYKLKHLSKVEVVTTDPSGCTFMLGFDNLKIRSHTVTPAQWTMRNVDDRNRLLLCIINICKDHLDRSPKVVGIDVVEMALWAKENKSTVTKQQVDRKTDQVATEEVEEEDIKVTVERDMVSQTEEEDLEALLGTYVMEIGEAEAFSERLKRELQALEAANLHAILGTEVLVNEVVEGLGSASIIVDDMDEWLGIFNMKLRHMREDIESIETRNNKLEMQSVNNRILSEELDILVEKLRIPPEYAACLSGGSFEESHMYLNINSCEWLTNALQALEMPNLDSNFAKMRAVKEKRSELDRLKTAYVQRADEFLKKFFSNLVNYMLSDRNYFSQRGQLKRPNHEDIRYKFMTYALLVQYLKSLDKSCLGSLRKAYCSSLNLLMRREAREFAHELRSSMKSSKSPASWLDFSQYPGQTVDTSSVSEAYDKMLTVFIPMLDDESSFFATFMCFEVPGVVPSGTVANKNKGSTSEVETLNEFLNDLLDGIQEDFYSVADYAAKVDPLRCVSMHGITEKHIPNHKAETVGICIILDDLDSRISTQFHRFVDDSCHQIEKFERSARQLGVLPYIPRFGSLATRLEQYVEGTSRDLVDQAYLRLVSVMFVTLDKIAQTEPKYADIVLLENYAAFQNSLYDLANGVPTLAKFYHQASEGYEQACSRHISVTIYYQFERLFQFARRIEDLLTTVTAEEVHYQLGFSKSDLRKVVRSSLSGVDKSLLAMFKKLTKNITSEDLLPSLWDKCKKEFLDKYSSFAQLVAKVYPSEKIPPVPEIRDLLKSM